ncbi:hypothetical protein N9V49_03165 [Flavobacteriaceae bacterium]|nr:hypothetical protein [Flavobacteriaceae bacterium]
MNLSFFKYRYRFLLGYIFIGILSIILELSIRYILNEIFSLNTFSSFSSFILGVLFASWFNTKYNFKVSKSKINRALIYFIVISFISYIFQNLIISITGNISSYEVTRIVISAGFFWVAYLFHLKFSFRDYKKVGVAIYANGFEDLNSMFNKIENYPDFIHIDIVDYTMNESADEVLSYKTEVIKAFWNSKFIESHIMSKEPMKWVNEIVKNVDRIYIHLNINENVLDVLKFIKKSGCETGIVIHEKDDIKYINMYHDIIDSVLVLSIKNPGYSGQKFRPETLDIINLINSNKFRNKISLNVDGGINQGNVNLIDSENVVSGSYVLNSKNPKEKIMVLQTSSQYESI